MGAGPGSDEFNGGSLNKYSQTRSNKLWRKKATCKVRKTRRKKVAAARTIKRVFHGLKYAACTALILGAIGAAAGGTYRFYKSNDLFVLRDIICEGNVHLSQANILNILQLELGVKLLDVPVKELEKVLLKHPWVEKVSVQRRYPSHLKVMFQEKRLVALCYLSGTTAKRIKGFMDGSSSANRRKSQWYGVTAQGELLPDVFLKNHNLPIIEVPAGISGELWKGLCGFLGKASDKYSGIYNTMSQIKYTGHTDLAIFSRDNRLKFLVSIEGYEENILSFWDLLINQIGREFSAGQIIDLRVKEFAYVR
jgi:hypothetical protein